MIRSAAAHQIVPPQSTNRATCLSRTIERLRSAACPLSQSPQNPVAEVKLEEQVARHFGTAVQNRDLQSLSRSCELGKPDCKPFHFTFVVAMEIECWQTRNPVISILPSTYPGAVVTARVSWPGFGLRMLYLSLFSEITGRLSTHPYILYRISH